MNYSYDGDGQRVMKSNGTIYWYGMSGDPLDETDLSGNLQNEYVPQHVFFAHKFTGKERDSESGLDNFGARYITSNMGHFMTPDWAAAPMGVPYAKLGDPQTLNLYAYGRNNPVTLTDPNGHCFTVALFVACVAVAIAGAVYAVHKLNEWYKDRQNAENSAFQQSQNCTASNAQCSESQLRAYDTEHLHTYGGGAIKAIENTLPEAAPATTITGVVIDQAKDKAVDAMVKSAMKNSQQGQNQPNQASQPNSAQGPASTANTPAPNAPRIAPPPLPPPRCLTGGTAPCPNTDPNR